MAKDKEPTNAEIMDGVAEAALAANKEIQEGSYGGLAKALETPFAGSHYLAGSPYMGGGTAFADSNQAKVTAVMREADKAYREVGIVRNVVDIMTDFTSAGLNVHHPIAAQERFYRAWLNKVRMEEVAKLTLRGMYKWANVGIWRFWGKIKPKTKREMMAKAKELFEQGKDKEAIRAFFRDDDTIKASRIPVRYSCIPPFNVKIVGSLLFDTRVYYYKIPDDDRQRILNPDKNCTDFEKKLLQELPDTTRMMIEKESMMPIPPECFTMLHYKRDCSRLWADPIIMPIMNDLRYKQVLRRLDISVAESIINPITIFKLGNTKDGFAPTQQQFTNLATLLKTPVATKTLVWSDLISVEQHIVDAKEVFTTEKYKEVDSDILAGLGVSQVLISGGAGGGANSFGNAFLSVRTLLERLEDGRQEFMKFLNVELDYVRKAMGWKSSPIVTWDQMNLRDEAAEKRVIIELVDRKIISAESALDALGYDSTVEMARKVREQKAAEKAGVPISVGPFEESTRVQQGKDPARLGIDVQNKQIDQDKELTQKQLDQDKELSKEQMKHDQKRSKEEMVIKRKQVQVKKNSTGPRAGPGRPGGRGDPSSRKQKVKRETKPKGMGSYIYDPELISMGHMCRAAVEDYLKPKFLDSVAKVNLRQLTKGEKLTYEQLIRAVWSYSSPFGTVISEEWVVEMADQVANGSTPDVDADGNTVFSIYETLVAQYKEKNMITPDMAAQTDLFVRALILFNDTTGEINTEKFEE
jgi:hypothetical protein